MALNVNELPTIICSHVVQRFPPHCETVPWVLSVNLDLTNSCLRLGGCLLRGMNFNPPKMDFIRGLFFSIVSPVSSNEVIGGLFELDVVTNMKVF